MMSSLSWRTENRIRFWIMEEERRITRALAALNAVAVENQSHIKKITSPTNPLQNSLYYKTASEPIKT